MEKQPQGLPCPSTVKEAIEYLRHTMASEALAELASLPESRLHETHYGLAAGIRNEMLRQNTALLKDTGYRHRDDASAEIVRNLWLALQEANDKG